MSESCLSGSGITVEVPGKTLLDQVELELCPGEVLGLIGPNGAGKSTLLRVLAGLITPARGDVRVAGETINAMPAATRARHIAFLPQSAELHWSLTVESVVRLGRLPHRGSKDQQADDVAVDSALQRTEMSALRQRSMDTLSGGERMRVLVARMLAVGAEILLADEPVTGLDPYFQLEFMDLFVAEAAQGKGVILVLHDLALAARYCDRLVLMNAGTIAAAGSPKEILAENVLQSVYRVESVHGEFAGQPYVLPWKRKT